MTPDRDDASSTDVPAELLGALRELAALHERQVEVLTRISEMLQAGTGPRWRENAQPAGASVPGEEPVSNDESAPADDSARTGEFEEASSEPVRQSEPAARSESARAPAAESKAAESKAAESKEGESKAGESASPSVLPRWIDEMVDAALSHAFTQEMQEEDEADGPDKAGSEMAGPSAGSPAPASRPRSAPEAAAAGEPSSRISPGALLLLLSCGETWIAIPWREVEQFGLAEESDPAAYEYSLRDMVEPDGPLREEPYRLSWIHGQTAISITFEGFGEIVDTAAAATRGVQAVMLPAGAPEIAPELIPLVEYVTEIETAIETQSAAHDGESTDVGETTPVAVEESTPAGDGTLSLVPDEEPTPDRDEESTAVPVSVAESATERGAEEATLPPPAPSRAEEVTVRSAPGAAPSALLALRYLPARIAIGRFLRASGWTVLEAFDSEEIPSRLKHGRFDAIFTELFERPSLAFLHGLRQAQSSGSRVFAVGSRLRATGREPSGEMAQLPKLLYPFQENDLQRVVSPLSRS